MHIPDMAAESRWPRFTAAAAEAGIGAMLCFQLFVADSRLGALNLYASQAGAFDEEARFTGLIFATHAAVAITGARQEETLSTALANRDIIGQAKSTVMERFHPAPSPCSPGCPKRKTSSCATSPRNSSPTSPTPPRPRPVMTEAVAGCGRARWMAASIGPPGPGAPPWVS